MARIAEAEIERLKAEISLVRLVETSGVQLEKRGKDWAALCPFHEEATPSFVVTPDKNLFRCFGCGVAGGPIDWGMKRQGVSFRHTVELLREGLPLAAESASPVKHSTVRALAPPVSFDCGDTIAVTVHIIDLSPAICHPISGIEPGHIMHSARPRSVRVYRHQG